MEVNQIKEIIEKTLSKNKANNIVTIDLKKKSYIADYMIIASGTSSRHLQSLSENIVVELKKFGLNSYPTPRTVWISVGASGCSTF